MSKPTRCAIYTRKSSDEGLDQSFNSLDAQREAGEAYVKSQASEGWIAIATRYDDGGFSGGSMERPGLKKLLDGCCQSNRNLSPLDRPLPSPASAHPTRFCHSARAAERRVL
jgi:hypothetical protein